MATNYYVSPRFFKPKTNMPFWIFPLSLFSILIIVLLVTLYITQRDSSGRSFSRIEQTVSSPANLNAVYQSAVENFRNGSYYTSAQQFKAIFNQNYISATIKQSSGVFYAYSLLIEGIRTANNDLIRQAHQMFTRLLRESPSNNEYFARIALGYARATRFLGVNYNIGTEQVLNYVSSLPSAQSLKHQLDLELGYFYFYSGNYALSTRYFLQARLYIDSPVFLDSLVSKEDSEKFILTLLQNKLIPQNLLLTYGGNIKQKLLRLSVEYIRVGQYNIAKNIMQILSQSFSTDAVSEDTNFLLGFMAQQERKYKDALFYYEKVINNGYLDKDAVALFQMGVIYFNIKQYQQSVYYFNMLVQKFPYGYYAGEAQKWLAYYYPARRTLPMNGPPIVPQATMVMNESMNYDMPPSSSNRNNKTSYTSSSLPEDNSAIKSNIANDNRPVVNVNIDHSTNNVSSNRTQNKPYSIYEESQQSTSDNSSRDMSKDESIRYDVTTDKSYRDNSSREDSSNRDYSLRDNSSREDSSNRDYSLRDNSSREDSSNRDYSLRDNSSRDNSSREDSTSNTDNSVRDSRDYSTNSALLDDLREVQEMKRDKMQRNGYQPQRKPPKGIARQNVTDDEDLSRDFAGLDG